MLFTNQIKKLVLLSFIFGTLSMPISAQAGVWGDLLKSATNYYEKKPIATIACASALAIGVVWGINSVYSLTKQKRPKINSQYTINLYKDTDDKDIRRIGKLNAKWLSETEDYISHTARDNAHRTYVLHHIENNQKTVAAFLVYSKDNFIHFLAVDPQFTQHEDKPSYGYGEKLLRYAIKDMRDKHKLVSIGLGTDAQNIRAQNLYEKVGFEVDNDNFYIPYLPLRLQKMLSVTATNDIYYRLHGRNLENI